MDVEALVVVALSVVIYPTGVIKELKYADAALKIAAARFPVIVKFETVVDPSVEEPVIFAFAPVIVPETVVEDTESPEPATFNIPDT